MIAPITWWQNRKSRMGMKPSAKRPPNLPSGDDWWTTPPIAAPQPEHIEYVVQYFNTLMTKKPQGRNHAALVKYLADWLKAARRLLHEEMQAPERKDLQTTDGVIIAAAGTMARLCLRVTGLGGVIEAEDQEVVNALRGRADKLRRERALKL